MHVQMMRQTLDILRMAANVEENRIENDNEIKKK